MGLLQWNFSLEALLPSLGKLLLLGGKGDAARLLLQHMDEQHTAVSGIIFQTIIGSTRDKSISTLMDVSSWFGICSDAFVFLGEISWKFL